MLNAQATQRLIKGKLQNFRKTSKLEILLNGRPLQQLSHEFIHSGRHFVKFSYRIIGRLVEQFTYIIGRVMQFSNTIIGRLVEHLLYTSIG